MKRGKMKRPASAASMKRPAAAVQPVPAPPDLPAQALPGRVGSNSDYWQGAPVRAHHDQRRGAGADEEPLDAAVPDHEPEEPRLPGDRRQHGQRGRQHVVVLLNIFSYCRCLFNVWVSLRGDVQILHGQRGVTVELPPGVVLGCTKCRKSQIGCQACRLANGLSLQEVDNVWRRC